MEGLRNYLYSTLSPANMLWLGRQLTEYAQKEKYSMKPFTMEELNTRLDEAEAEIAAGIGTSHEEMMREWEEELPTIFVNNSVSNVKRSSCWRLIKRHENLCKARILVK